jgi:hypothetical protein
MRKVTENLIHQGWINNESLAARPGRKFPIVKVPMFWLKRSTKAVKLLQKIYGKPTRLFRIPAAVQILYRNGNILSLSCPLQDMDAYLAALKEMLSN